MRIEYLIDHRRFLAELAGWHHLEWRHLHPGETLADRMRSLEADLGRRGVPTTVVAFDGARLLGSASLLACDMDTHPELTPWLASVYVAATERRRGVGRALVARIEAEARALGVVQLHLFTPDRPHFYAAMGWDREAEEVFHGERVTRMSKRLA